MANYSNKNITVTIPQEMISFLDKLATLNDMSRSQALRFVVRKYQENEAVKSVVRSN